MLFVVLCGWPFADLFAAGPAGMILYFRSGGEVFLLLADHAKGPDQARGWAAFGGGQKDQETAAQTAARETEEETNGYFSRDWLLKKIENQKPVVDGIFSCFFAEVDFVPIPPIASRRPPTQEPDYFERGPYAWIPFSKIAPFLAKDADPNSKAIIPAEYLPSGGQTNWFWSIWLQNLRIAQAQGVLPWENQTLTTVNNPK